MTAIDVLIIGAGQAGLAMSTCLSASAIDHVLLERGRIAERWRSQRWDSLRLLTPNWMTRLPGHAYRGPDPHGFLHKDAVTTLLETYAAAHSAPVLPDTRVLGVTRNGSGYRVDTDRGAWQARAVVLATGACDRPRLPDWASRLPGHIHQITPDAYRSPADLPRGGVLVVGASATGVQLAEEIHASFRPVTLAAGQHVRLPRSYRGRDLLDWMALAGVLDQPAEAVRDLAAARRAPSLQLVGRPGVSLDLPHLARFGVRIIGRALGVDGDRLQLAGDLAALLADAEHRRRRLLARIDAHIAEAGIAAPADPGAWDAPRLVARAPGRLDLRGEGIRSVVWATGYRRDYGWLRVPVLDAAGELRHDGGVTPAPGLYVLGLPFLRRRNSPFIDGVGRDAEALAVEIARQLRQTTAQAA